MVKVRTFEVELTLMVPTLICCSKC